MPRTLVLHAGLPKTGTTTIQNAFWRARETLLRSQGLCYPSIEANHTNAVCTLFLDDPSVHITNRIAALRGELDLPALQARYRNSLEADLCGDSNWQRAIISAEGISNLSAQEIAKFRDWARTFADKIEVLFWVREPVSYMTSVVQQLLKGGQTLQELQNDPLLPNFKGKISNAISVFGRDAVRVESFEAAIAHPDGLVAAFARHVGLSPQAAAMVQSHASHDNESLSMQAALLLDALNRARPLFGEGTQPRTGRETAYLEAIRGDRFRLPHAFRKRVYDLTREDVAWLNATFGTDLYNTPFANQADQPTSMPPETMTSVAVLVSNLLNVIEALTLTLNARDSHAAGDSQAVAKHLTRARTLAPESALIARQSRQMNADH